MSRIRTIKPEAHKDAELWDAEQETGLPLFRAFTALWCQADSAWSFEWRPRRLKIEALPYWGGDFCAVLDALAGAGLIRKEHKKGAVYGVFVDPRRYFAGDPKPQWSTDSYQSVIDRDGPRCRYCGENCLPTIDHVVPRCQGGGDEPSNLVVACRRCNSRKGGRTPAQARMELQ